MMDAYPWSWGMFGWFTAGALIWCLAVYGAYALFFPRQCDLPIGALL